jgi:RNA polymerase sigma-70 factor (ECF subfamily)
MIDPKEVAYLQELTALSGDQTAYVRLYRIYFAHLLRFARSFVRSVQEAEEIVSDVFLQIWQMRDKLHTIHNLTVYLYTSTRNHSLNHLARQKRSVLAAFNEGAVPEPVTVEDPEQLCLNSELVRKIDQAVEQLPSKCRIIFKLVREDGLKYREVAEVLDVSQKTVEAQMGIAMRKIGEAIRPYIGGTAYPAYFPPVSKKLKIVLRVFLKNLV